ncbi:hypothetical protein JM658_07585 [Joostella atrarenae]|uniref:Alpha-galactosidase n=1 Tax=Joostella atrarenae TaxID=679257 RepID=A0ABS9J2S2_9FLAO|nr:hypothetical protein [Joostella atrarenae]MCF8714689.1 hypothetical protein [Joostella atrarenae]
MQLVRNIFGLSLLFIILIGKCYSQKKANSTDLHVNLDKAKATYKNNKLYVSTGKISRTWVWSGAGFKTVSFKNKITGKEWATNALSSYDSDWNLPNKIGNNSKASLISVDCKVSNDDNFTSKHLLVTTEVLYEHGIQIKYLIRVYPNELGLWTALEVRVNEGFSTEGIPKDIAYKKYYGSNQPIKIARTEYVPVDFSLENKRRYWGYYNDPGNRVNTKDMVKEEVVEGWPLFSDEQNTWASGLSIETGNEGLILLKESNKTVNNYGHQTGSFYCTPKGVEVTGWGLKPNEITNEFRRTWATWSILYSDGEDGMQLALKKFDRTRFPINKERDMHMLVDTWGSDYREGKGDKIYGRENSEFSVIEKEIKSASELGMDIVRIDDGWQDGDTFSRKSWHPNTNIGYDADWKNVKKLAESNNIKIGLWAAIRYISPEEMRTNQEKLDVATWKLDFDKIEDWESYHVRMDGIRDFIKFSNYQTQVSWCPEYDDPRYGWYSTAREYGPMYFQNIQNNMPHHIVYVPYVTLRHHWMMSKFYNMNKLQTNWQNPSRTNSEFSDAVKHSQSYCAMTAFVGVPAGFMLTQLMKPEEKAELKKLIEIYKKERTIIFDSYVFPIGNKPNNASWTGFQIYHPDKKTGYLMVFRELHNSEESKEINVKFLEGKKIRLIDLEQSKSNSKIITVSNNKLKLEINKTPGYRFFRYTILEE